MTTRIHTKIAKTIAAAAMIAAVVAPGASASPSTGTRITIPPSLANFHEPGSTGYVRKAQQHALTPADGRSPDTRDAAQAAQARLLVPSDGRSPDTIDAAIQAHSPVVTVTLSPGFDWADFGIGVAAAFGTMLLLGLTMRLLTARQSRKQPRPVATA